MTTATADDEVEAALLDAVLIAVDPGKRLPTDLLITLRLGDGVPYPTARTTLQVIVNAPLMLPLVTEIAAPADNIRLGVSPPGRPIPRAAAARTGQWRRTTIQEDDDAVRGQDE